MSPYPLSRLPAPSPYGRGRIRICLDLIRDFSKVPSQDLCQLVSLANGQAASIALATLGGFTPVNATLALSAGPRNLGIRLPADGRSFEWIATRDAFEDASILVEPLLTSLPNSFQWLLGGESGMQWQLSGEVGFVVSVSEDGGW